MPTGEPIALANRREALAALCGAHGLLSVYLFGSRADDGLRLLAGKIVAAAGSDLDIGVVATATRLELDRLVALDLGFAEIFSPLRVDVVSAERVDSLFQLSIIEGHRVFAADSTAADLFELLVFRRAADTLPYQRQREIELFGVSTS